MIFRVALVNFGTFTLVYIMVKNISINVYDIMFLFFMTITLGLMGKATFFTLLEITWNVFFMIACFFALSVEKLEMKMIDLYMIS